MSYAILRLSVCRVHTTRPRLAPIASHLFTRFFVLLLESFSINTHPSYICIIRLRMPGGPRAGEHWENNCVPLFVPARHAFYSYYQVTTTYVPPVKSSAVSYAEGAQKKDTYHCWK